MGGNNGSNPEGTGCDAADLCAPGWHVCISAADVASHSPTGCGGATRLGDPPRFFVTRQSSNGFGVCATGARTAHDCNSASGTRGCKASEHTTNDVFGCGNFGAPGPLVDCSPLDRMGNDHCFGLRGSNWVCDDDGSGLCEAATVVHYGADFGGVLCCRD
jgi:hypothetical protein